jgi:signal transduction histidine kinase
MFLAMTVAPGRARLRWREAVPLDDVLLAVGLALFAQVDLRVNLDNSTHYGSDTATSVVVTVAALALAWRRTHPLATLAVVAAATAGPELVTELTITLWGHFVPLLVACYSAARWCGRRGAVCGASIVGAATAVMMLRVPAVGTAGNVPFTLVPLTVAFVAGRVLRARAEKHRELTRHAAHLERLEHERETRLAEAVEEERSRIARDLHDVVAHCVSVMVVQAGACEDLLDRDLARARDSLRAVQETGQQAVGELGRMLGLLRGEDDGATLAPQPGVSRLPELAERMSDLGLPVRLTVTGDVRPLPPGVDLTTYRIVQEALTNTLRHAGPGANAFVELGYRQRGLDVEVLDDGHGGRRPTAGSGHGVVGMTERAAVYGGALEVGPRPDGGFRVHVTLPMAPA